MLLKTFSRLLLPATRKAVPRATWVGELMRGHAAAFVRAALDEGVTPDEALDAMQDAAVTFLTRSLWLDLESKPDEARALLTTLTRNHARNRRRRHGREVVPTDAIPDDAQPDLTREALERELEYARRHVLLTGCISTLRGHQRAVVLARVLDGQSSHDVARSLQLTPGHVAVALHRAKLRLQACVARSEKRFS
jgi:RNA polymerase sigma-70 factor (ECF subfamily)